MSTNAVKELGRRELTRWFWRQLTSMRTALFLLLLLAITAVPGSLYPQRSVDPRNVEAYFIEHPKSAPVLDKLGFFSVYTSPWFSAVYLLLLVSLVGCILPRSFVYFRALRARPPKAPKNFSRLPASASFETEASVDDVLAAGRRTLGRARVDRVVEGDAGELRAETGFLREAGNLVFHISVVVVLLGVAFGTLFGYRGTAIVTEGDGFSNVLTQYDEFASGSLFDTDKLPPFSLTLDKFTARFQLTGPQRGAPRKFEATGRYAPTPSSAERPFDITVNHPLKINGTSVYLVGQGYAPEVRITDAQGHVVFDDAVPFLPTDPSYTSTGVIKVPGAKPEQLGLQGFFLPTAVAGKDGVAISAFPAAANPHLGLFVWHGDLGLDTGQSQSVYVLDKSKMKQYMASNGKGYPISLNEGQTQKLPDGGTIQYVKTLQFVRFQFSSTPFVKVPLFGVATGVLGLILSLSIKPRRTWIRARRDGSRTVVDVAVLDRVPRDDLPADLDDFLERFRESLGVQEKTV
jgi:cytochrome c biogenesis protein